MSAARGFTAVPNAVVRDASLPPATRLLYGVILSYAFGGRACTASVETLCEDTGIGRTAFFAGVTALRERGLLKVEKRKSRNGWRNVYVPVAKGVEITGADDDEGRSDSDQRVVRETNGGSSATRTQKKKRTEEEASADAEAAARASDQLPDDFPEELREHARAVYRVLVSVAEQHNARAVKPLALGRVLMARPRKPLVRAAHDFGAWAADPPRPIRDVVASYRRWLDNERDLQAVERLPGEAPANGNGNGGAAKRFTRED